MPTVTVTTTPTLLVAAKAPSLRGSVFIEVRRGGVPVYFSSESNVTPSTGFAIEPTASQSSNALIENDPLSKPAKLAWWAVVESGSQSVIVQEGPP